MTLAMMKDFDLLKNLIANHKEDWDIGSPPAEELIEKAETFLQVTFPEALRLYLQTWGTLSIGPLEYYGIVNSSNFEESQVPNGVWFTKSKREQLGLPSNLFVVYNNDGDEYHCVNLDNDQIVVWNTFSKDITAVKASNLFGYIREEASDFL